MCLVHQVLDVSKLLKFCIRLEDYGDGKSPSQSVLNCPTRTSLNYYSKLGAHVG